jgi:hypothetical protein
LGDIMQPFFCASESFDFKTLVFDDF